MSKVLIYRHPGCARCARIARAHHAFDLLGNVDDTTDTPPSGPLRMGQIVVKDRATGRLAVGAEAFALICRTVPVRSLRFDGFVERYSVPLDGVAERAGSKRVEVHHITREGERRLVEGGAEQVHGGTSGSERCRSGGPASAAAERPFVVRPLRPTGIGQDTAES